MSTPAEYTQKQLQKMGKSPQWLLQWLEQWTPESFHKAELGRLSALSGDAQIVESVRSIQKWIYGCPGDEAMGIPQQDATPGEMDGKLGSGTQRRMETWEEFTKGVEFPSEPTLPGGTYLLFNGEQLSVPGVTIVQPSSPGGLSFESSYQERKAKDKKAKPGYGYRKQETVAGSPQVPDGVGLLATIHWDVCFGARSCFKQLSKRGLSSVFGIDHPRKSDGQVMVYQWLDFGKHYGFHAGTPANKMSLVSFDMSSAVDLKYASKYLDLTGIPRPVIDGRPHGKRRQLLGMYRGQILALLRILKALALRFPELSFSFPTESREPVQTVWKPLFKGGYSGAHTHLHITENKWDVTGLEAQIIYLMRKDHSVQKEFPSIASLFHVTDDALWAEWEAQKDKDWTWTEVTG